MDKMIIRGMRPLAGPIRVSGAKNAALPVLAAALLTKEECVFHNVPDLMDVKTMRRLLTYMGASAEGRETLVLKSAGLTTPEAPYDLVKTMRASILVLGPLVARLGTAKVSLPGGCAIGARPVDLHLRALEQLGASISLRDGYIEAQALRLAGTNIYFDLPTVTGTENIMMAACLARGTTRLHNAAREPEIINLAEVLNSMGAQVRGAGTDVIVIEGVEKLHGTEAAIIPDRIEAGTFLIAAAITGGEITLTDYRQRHLDALIEKLTVAGVRITETPAGLQASGRHPIRNVDIKTMPFPGFPTDLQAQMMALMAAGTGLSVITETVFENRFMHVSELLRMGAKITVQGHSAIVTGGRLSGAKVMATDLRASAGLILAALAAEGETVLSRVYHIDRGYESIEKKLSHLGADIVRAKE
jgi:UDP-N-acetylglucosamine 1-carboxyvinyltransferase